MHLLMTTYRQDIMTNFSCVHNRSVTYLPIFQGSFPKYTQVYLSNNLVMPIKERSYHSIVQIIKVILNFQLF